MGSSSLKSLNFTDRSYNVHDSAAYTRASDNEVVVLICGVIDESILTEGGESKGGSHGYVMAVNASGNFSPA